MFHPFFFEQHCKPKRFIKTRISGIALVRWTLKTVEPKMTQHLDFQLFDKESVIIKGYRGIDDWMSPSEYQSENPKLYTNAAAAFRDLEEETDCDDDGVASFAFWVYDQHYHLALTKYMGLENFFPGCPRA